jgi:hypothetical protein
MDAMPFFWVLDIVFDFWFGILLVRINNLKATTIMYMFLLGVRIFLFFSPEPLPSLAIPEPNSTILFFITGAVIGAFYLFRFAWQKMKE